MYYDLNVPWTANTKELQSRLSFLAELGYNVVAISHTLRPAATDLTNPIPTPLPFPPPHGIRRVLTRCTVPLASGAGSSKNPRLGELRPHYDVIAVLPTDERSLQQACSELDVDVISLDLARRHPFVFKHSTIGAAVRRGVAVELCYSTSTAPGSEGASGASQAGASQTASTEAEARRNAFSNAQALLRASRGGRGVVISSGARSALGIRAPADVVNLAIVWGMRPDAAADAVGETARKAVAATHMRGKSFRGVVEVVYGGEKPAPVPKTLVAQGVHKKRKAGDGGEEDGESPAAKRETKQAAKRAKKEARRASAVAREGESSTAERPAEGRASEVKLAVTETS